MYCTGKIGANQLSSMNIFYVNAVEWRKYLSIKTYAPSGIFNTQISTVAMCFLYLLLNVHFTLFIFDAFTFTSFYIHIWAWRNKHLFNISHEPLWYYLNDEKYSSSWLKKSCCTRAVAAAVSSWQIKLIREQRSIAPLLYCHIVIEAKFHSWAILI